MQSTSKKSISKASTNPKGPAVASLAELCAETLYKHSIKAGKVDELIAALQADPDGRRALEALLPKPERVVVVNLADSDVTEGTCGYLKCTEKSQFLFTLLDHYDAGDEPDHPLGGDALTWTTNGEALEWMQDIVEAMDLYDAQVFFEEALDIHIPKRDEEGALVESATDWLENYGYDWHTLLENTLGALFAVDNLVNDNDPAMLTAAEVRQHYVNGVHMRVRAVFTINLDTFE